MPPMKAMRRHAVETTALLLLGTALLLAISASPAGRDSTPAPMIDFTKLKISSGIVALADREDNEVDCCCFCLLFSVEEVVEERKRIDFLARCCCFCDGKIFIDAFLSFAIERAPTECTGNSEEMITVATKHATEANHRLDSFRENNLMVWLFFKSYGCLLVEENSAK